MKKAIIFTLLLSLPLILAQCNHSQDGEHHHMMGEEQMSQMMQNPEQRQAMMSQMMQNSEHRQAMMSRMAENPEMRGEMMNHMMAGMEPIDHDRMMNHMQSMMEDPEHREQMLTHLQQMQAVLESDEFDRNEMRRIMQNSDMMQMHIRCMHIMHDSDTIPDHN